MFMLFSKLQYFVCPPPEAEYIVITYHLSRRLLGFRGRCQAYLSEAASSSRGLGQGYTFAAEFNLLLTRI